MSILANIKRRVTYLYERHVWYIATMHIVFLIYMLCCLVFSLYMVLLYCSLLYWSPDKRKQIQHEQFMDTASWYIFLSMCIGSFLAFCVPFRTKSQTFPKPREICANIEESDITHNALSIGKISDHIQEKQNEYVIIVQPYDI